MENNKSILNKIILSKQTRDAYKFSAPEIISKIFSSLSAKEKDVIRHRFGLEGEERQTLEEIGQGHHITRERIRQIQSSVIKKIKSLEEIKEYLDAFSSTVKRIIGEYGGIMEEAHLLNELAAFNDDSEHSRRATTFIISELLDDHVEHVKKTERVLPGWKLRMFSIEALQEILEVLYDLIEKENRLFVLKELIGVFKNSEYFSKNKTKILLPVFSEINDDSKEDVNLQNYLQSYLTIASKIDKNILNEWGLKHWPIVTPKRMGDKVYLILKKENKPMHFTEITTAINNTKFDKKIAYPATIHNELILDDRFVLVGRGIYALKEWGYESGTVSDVIVEILKKAGRPMTKDEIADVVLKKRLVKTGTIFLALTNKNRFKKIGNTYILA